MIVETLDLGGPGNCLSCSKHRENVIGGSCIDCLVYYGLASPSLRVAVEHGITMYRRGYESGIAQKSRASWGGLIHLDEKRKRGNERAQR